jgi:hypothetical protein
MVKQLFFVYLNPTTFNFFLAQYRLEFLQQYCVAYSLITFITEQELKQINASLKLQEQEKQEPLP